MSDYAYELPPKLEKYRNDRLLRLKDVLKLLPISRSQFYDRIKDGDYPQPVKLGARVSAWWESEILEILHRETVRRG